MFEHYFEASFLLRFVGMEFNVFGLKFLHYIGICDGTSNSYFEAACVNILYIKFINSDLIE